MATRKPAAADVPRKTRRAPRKTAAKTAAPPPPRRAPGADAQMREQMARMANLMTPEQAIELYKANAKMALDVINAAIDSTARLRKLQFEGEESAREFQRKAARASAEAKDAQSLVAIGQETGREALEKSLAYWQEMFGLIVEIQQRLFSLIEDQAQGMPGYRQAKAAMAMMPDLGPMKNVVDAMQGLVGSGGNAFATMQKMMSDLAQMAQSSMPGGRR
ncbi:MAG: hypothetical protein BroJett026_25360 [Betaproteobacteria bacterium]|nr:MAG: hypothetical protein BroJett026_25360 [Betaproteobacteria bacterium]